MSQFGIEGLNIPRTPMPEVPSVQQSPTPPPGLMVPGTDGLPATPYTQLPKAMRNLLEGSKMWPMVLDQWMNDPINAALKQSGTSTQDVQSSLNPSSGVMMSEPGPFTLAVQPTVDRLQTAINTPVPNIFGMQPGTLMQMMLLGQVMNMANQLMNRRRIGGV